MIRSPIKWVGGKSRLRKVLVGLLPPHACYVEVFGGAGWVLLAKEPSGVEAFNDIDGELINFFTVVKEQPDALLESFEWELVSREKFERLRNQAIDGLSTVQRAHRFYYLTMASWGGELGSARFQTSKADPIGHGNRLIGALKTLHERIRPVHRRLQNVIIDRVDWRRCIDNWDASYDEKGVVMYLDPPYPQNNCNYQHNMRSWAEHVELVERLRSVKARFLLSGYDTPEMRELCKGLSIVSVNFAAGMPSESSGRSRNREIIVANFALPGASSIVGTATDHTRAA